MFPSHTTSTASPTEWGKSFFWAAVQVHIYKPTKSQGLQHLGFYKQEQGCQSLWAEASHLPNSPGGAKGRHSHISTVDTTSRGWSRVWCKWELSLLHLSRDISASDSRAHTSLLNCWSCCTIDRYLGSITWVGRLYQPTHSSFNARLSAWLPSKSSEEAARPGFPSKSLSCISIQSIAEDSRAWAAPLK